MRFGLLLPHFGSQFDASRLLDGVVRAERLGFDSVWVRDHIVYAPHSFEDPDPTWLDPFVVLSTIAGLTSRLALGTATLIPHRHPIDAAQLIASLAAFAGPERLIMGWGRGNDDREFAAVQMEVQRRGEVLEEQIGVIRSLWAGDRVDHSGRYYKFENVTISTTGLGKPVAFWYGGGSVAANDRVLRLFDGLLASRIPRSVLEQRVQDLRSRAADLGREAPNVGLVTLVSPGERQARIDVDRLVRDTARRYPERTIQSEADLDGVLIRGLPERVAEEVLAYGAVGVEHFIFDLRAHFDEWLDCIDLLAEEVLPRIRGAHVGSGANA